MTEGAGRSVILKSVDKFEDRVCSKLYMNFAKSAIEGLEMLHQDFDEHCLGRIHIFEWYACFKADEESVQDNQSPAKHHK